MLGKFEKIVFVDDCGLVGSYKDKVYELAEQVVEYQDVPTDNDEIIHRINDADCILVSWKTKIDGEVLSQCPKLKYMGMCCSLYDEKSANVDIAKARSLGIIVKGVRDYGDHGTLEFIFSQLIILYSNVIPNQLGKEPTELNGKVLGIIGMGVLGQMVARMAINFGMRVVYYSRSRKKEIEHTGAEYYPLDEMLPQCDVISIHLPRNTMILGKDEFQLMKHPSVLVQTSLGLPFNSDAFKTWIDNNENYAIFDGAENTRLFGELAKEKQNILITSRASGFTKEAKGRLTEKVWLNMSDFLKK